MAYLDFGNCFPQIIHFKRVSQDQGTIETNAPAGQIPQKASRGPGPLWEAVIGTGPLGFSMAKLLLGNECPGFGGGVDPATSLEY